MIDRNGQKPVPVEFAEFRDSILAQLQDFYGTDASVVVQEIPGEAGKLKNAVLIHFTEDAAGNVPPIFLDELYTEFKKGALILDDCIGEIVNTREDYRGNEGK